MIRRPPRSTRTDLLPYTTLFRSPSLCAAGPGSRDDGFRCALPILRAALGEEPEKSPGANPGLDSSSRSGSVRVDDLGAGDQVVAAATVAAEDQQYLDDLDQGADERDDPEDLDRPVALTDTASTERTSAGEERRS